MIALDSSVVVAGFGQWHEHHAIARDVLAAGPVVPVHAGLEAYSVLTRLPPPFRAEPHLVADYLRRTFPSGHLALDVDTQADLPARLAGLGIAGGAVYDALIGLAADAAGAELLTLDRRALTTYDRCQVRARLLTRRP